MLKPNACFWIVATTFQPPSGGCVLKQSDDLKKSVKDKPAAFGRLCVETIKYGFSQSQQSQPPSGGCVLKQDMHVWLKWSENPAAFGRLCVETPCMNPVK